MQKLKVLDLFSGIGGFSLGLERTGGFETVAFCEIDPFCQKVLKKHWPEVPIFEDVRTLDYEGSVDVISGGYPCQPFSLAGKREGTKDDRHLWPAMFNLIKKYRPAWVIGENVAGHINMGLDSVLADLESEGYGSRVFVIPACAVDAKHRRDRLWIVANDDSQRSGTPRTSETQKGPTVKASSTGEQSRPLAHAESKQNRGLQQPRLLSNTGTGSQKAMANSESVYAQRQQNRSGEEQSRGGCRWEPEPAVGRVVNGLSGRVDRLKGLGNAVVPQIPEIIGDAILQSINISKGKDNE